MYIVDSGATSHMVKSEENMTNLKDAKTRVTVGYIRTLTGTKCDNCNIWKKRDGKIHRVTLTNTAVISGLHAYIFSVTRSLEKGFQVTSEGEIPILKKKSTKICFDEKMMNKASKGFLLTTNFFNNTNGSAIVEPKKRKMEGKASIQPEGTSVKK